MMPAPRTQLDIMSPETAADPWPLLRDMRERGPVVWHEHYKRWLVTADHEVRAVLGDFKTFVVEGTSSAALFGDEAFIVIDDRKRHDALRLVWADAFRKPSLERLRPRIGEIVSRLLDPAVARLRQGEAVDVTTAICRPLPTIVILLMMGVPDEMMADVVRWSDAMADGGPAYLLGEAAARAAIARREDAKSALAEYLGDLLVERRARPKDDLVSALAHAEPARGLPDAHLVQNLRQLLFAGNETTAKWLAHIFVAYGHDPDLQSEVAADRSLVSRVNDEVMRWQGVVGTLIRRVRGGPVTLGGVELGDGDDITCLLTAANRDPRRFKDPETFDIHRPVEPNLGFGVGLHNCLGINLAKLEAETLFNGLFDRISGFRLAEPPQYSSLPLRGPQPVVVTLDG